MTHLRKIPGPVPAQQPSIELMVRDSVALSRLVEEIRNCEPGICPTAYNRTYHRHNR